MGCWVDIIDIASYTEALILRSILSNLFSYTTYRDAPAPLSSKTASNGSQWYRFDHATLFGYLLCSFCTHSSDDGFLTGSPSPDLKTHFLVVQGIKMQSPRLCEGKWVELRIDNVDHWVFPVCCLDHILSHSNRFPNYIVFERNFYDVVGLDDASISGIMRDGIKLCPYDLTSSTHCKRSDNGD